MIRNLGIDETIRLREPSRQAAASSNPKSLVIVDACFVFLILRTLVRLRSAGRNQNVRIQKIHQ